MNRERELEVLDWGLVPYGEALARQRELAAERRAGRAPDRLVLVEHPPVITLGRSGGNGDLLIPEAALTMAGVPVFRVERGGQATLHAPGQVVAYPIVGLRAGELHEFLADLLAAGAAVARAYGLAAVTPPGRPGLWVGGAKLLSVGLAVQGGVSLHGLALNVNNDLALFAAIVPCGHPGERLTSLARELGRPLDLAEVKARLADEVRARLARPRGRHPAWLRRPAPDPAAIAAMEERLAGLGLHTVCQEAHCPNLGECFGRGTATFLILGPRCTRACAFCAVEKGAPAPPDPEEPARVARAAASLGLRHVVVTSTTRDDLADGGAGHFARVLAALRAALPGARREVLIPDFGGSAGALDRVLAARPEVLNHNLETVARLYPRVRPRAGYARSLAILRQAANQGLATKSGLMLGLGESPEELRAALRDLRRAGCHYLTLGQYLAPSPAHRPVARLVEPAEFAAWREEALALGFAGVAAGPLVRSSYRAEEMHAGGEFPGEGRRPLGRIG